MTKLWLGLLLAMGLAASPVARADEEYDKLLKEFQDAQQKFYERLSKQAEENEAKLKEQGEDKEKGEIEAIDMTKGSPVIEFMPRFREYAEKHGGKPEAIPALVWIIGSAGMGMDESGKGKSAASWAIERLTKDHAAQVESADARCAVGRECKSFHRSAADRIDGLEPLAGMEEGSAGPERATAADHRIEPIAFPDIEVGRQANATESTAAAGSTARKRLAPTARRMPGYCLLIVHRRHRGEVNAGVNKGLSKSVCRAKLISIKSAYPVWL